MKWCGDVLREFRKAANMTQRELGKKIGTSQQTIQNYECDDVIPKFSVITDLAKALNISEAQLLDIDLEEEAFKTGFRAGASFIIDKMCKDMDKALLGRW